MKYLYPMLIFSVIFQVQAMNQYEFVERLKNTHPFFSQQALSSKIKQVEKRATTANQDWIIGINSNYKNEDASDIVNSTYSKLDTTSVNISATKKLLKSGSNITFKRSLIDTNKDINTTRNRFSVDYSYPLLRNSNGINDRLNTDIAQIAIEQNALERAEQEEDFILQKLKDFIDLAYAQEQLAINQSRLTLANQELNLVKQKFAASVVDKVDVLLQEDAYQAAQQQLLQARQYLAVLRHKIATNLALDFEQAFAKINLYKVVKLSNKHSKNQLLTNNRLIKIIDLERRAAKRQLSSFKNKDLAQLNLNLSLASEGENNNYSNSIKNQSPTWDIGLDLSYPLGGIQSSSDIEKTQLQLARLQQLKQQQLLNLYAQASALREKIDLLMQTLESNKKQIKIAKARTIEEKKRYSNGNGEASFVINAQNNEQNAQLNYAQVATDYQKSALEYMATLDQLTP